MILLDGANFDAATHRRYISTATGSANYALSPKEDGLHSSLRRMIRLVMTRSF
jgi:hypothetical protein